MIGVIIITHGELALALLSAMEHVIGKVPFITALSIKSDDEIEHQRELIGKTISNINQGQGVIILTDMFGGTPSNLAFSFLDKEPIEIISGVNLPMLIKIATNRENIDYLECAKIALEAGKNYIELAHNIKQNLT